MDFDALNITDLRVARLSTDSLEVRQLRVDSLDLHMRAPAAAWFAAVVALLALLAMAISTVLHHRHLRRAPALYTAAVDR